LIDRLSIRAKQHPRLYALLALLLNKQVVTLDYPVHPRPRWGYGQPPHQKLLDLIEAGRPRYYCELGQLMKFISWLHQIPANLWHNAFLPGLDGATLYAFTAHRRPSHYIEIGSGTSTQFVARAIADHRLSTQICSIDPAPRANVNALCNEIIRHPLEETDLALFDRLQAGDMLFVDNSHQAFQNADVTVFFLDILPTLGPGVLVGIHDIFLPDDYPPSYATNYYSEQYLLATYLLGGGQGITLVLPSWFASQDPQLAALTAPLFSHPRLNGVDTHGGIFWFITTATATALAPPPTHHGAAQ
jgi:predicted O-methyltransferase YrrM